MADNRMWLVHEATGQRVLLAKDFGYGWKLMDTEGMSLNLECRLAHALDSQHHKMLEPAFAPTDWKLEFEVER